MSVRAGRLLVTGAQALDDNARLCPVTIRIADGRIVEVGQGFLAVEPGERLLDASGEIVAPGLVNAHTHSTLAATRGTTDLMDHPSFMWTNQADTAGRSAEEAEAVTTLAAADMARHGTTSALDHVPEQNATPEAVAPIVEAWRKSAMRVAVALRIFDGQYEDIGDGGYSHADNPLKARPADELIGIVCDENLLDGVAPLGLAEAHGRRPPRHGPRTANQVGGVDRPARPAIMLNSPATGS